MVVVIILNFNVSHPFDIDLPSSSTCFPSPLVLRVITGVGKTLASVHFIFHLRKESEEKKF